MARYEGDFSQAEIEKFWDAPPKRDNFVTQDPIDITGLTSRSSKKSSGVSNTTKTTPARKPSPLASRSPGLGSIEAAPGANRGLSKADLVAEPDAQTKAIQDQTKTQQGIADKSMNAQLLLAAAKFGVDAMNANSAYGALSSSARLNIMESRRLANDAIARGKQRSLEARAEGMQAGESALLALAAQGQDVQGANAQKVQGSLEDIGLYNGLQEEIQGIREALGYDLEEVSINFQLEQAEIERDSTILSSGLQLGATAYATL